MKGLVKGEVTFKDSAAGLLLVETKKSLSVESAGSV